MPQRREALYREVAFVVGKLRVGKIGETQGYGMNIEYRYQISTDNDRIFPFIKQFFPGFLSLLRKVYEI